MNPQLRIGVLGVGHWGPNLMRNFDALGSLAAYCDLRAEVLQAQAALYPDARAFSDPEALIASADIDAVSIATPAAAHGPLVAQALAAGKHVLVEKPLCLDLEEARRLGAEAEARGLTLMVGHLLLYHPAFVALERIVASGRLGNLRYIYANRLSLGKIRREENALWSFAPHDASMILQLVGAMPESVTTSGGHYLQPGVADTTLSHIAFADGVQAHIFVSWLHPYKDHRLVVVGSEGMAVFHDNVAGPDKLLLYSHGVGWDGDVPSVNRAEATPIDYDEGEPLALECTHFVDCVASGRRPRSDAEEGIRVLAVLDACQRSLIGGGRPVTFDLTETAVA